MAEMWPFKPELRRVKVAIEFVLVVSLDTLYHFSRLTFVESQILNVQRTVEAAMMIPT